MWKHPQMGTGQTMKNNVHTLRSFKATGHLLMSRQLDFTFHRLLCSCIAFLFLIKCKSLSMNICSSLQYLSKLAPSFFACMHPYTVLTSTAVVVYGISRRYSSCFPSWEWFSLASALTHYSTQRTISACWLAVTEEMASWLSSITEALSTLEISENAFIRCKNAKSI